LLSVEIVKGQVAPLGWEWVKEHESAINLQVLLAFVPACLNYCHGQQWCGSIRSREVLFGGWAGRP